MKNKTTIIRVRKDKNNPYLMVSMSIFKSDLNGYEKAIMFELLGNNDNWTINKNNIEKRLNFSQKKFNDAWKSLENKHYITCERFFGGVKWIINEDPKANPNDYIQESNELEINNTFTDNSNVKNHNVLDISSTFTDNSITDNSNVKNHNVLDISSTFTDNSITDNSITDNSITDDHLINNKEINNNYNKPADLSTIEQTNVSETLKTNNIDIDKSISSPLDKGKPFITTDKDLFQYNITDMSIDDLTIDMLIDIDELH